MQEKFVVHTSEDEKKKDPSVRRDQFSGFKNLREQVDTLFSDGQPQSWKLVVIMGSMNRILEKMTNKDLATEIDKKIIN